MSRARDLASSGVTSTVLSAKAPLASPDFTGTVDLTGTTISLDNDQISGDKVSGGTIGAGTFDGTIGSSARANSLQPASGQSLVLKEDNGNAALTIDTSGNITINSGNVTINSGNLTFSSDAHGIVQGYRNITTATVPAYPSYVTTCDMLNFDPGFYTWTLGYVSDWTNNNGYGYFIRFNDDAGTPNKKVAFEKLSQTNFNILQSGTSFYIGRTVADSGGDIKIVVTQISQTPVFPLT